MEDNNIISIFTKKYPCENMHMPNEQFEDILNKNEFGTHVWECPDCNKRYLNLNRAALARVISSLIDTSGTISTKEE